MWKAETTTVTGNLWRLRDYKGKVIYIHFWATWCGKCRPSYPNLRKLHAKFQRNEDFIFVGVCLDSSRKVAMEAKQKYHFEWDILHEPGKVGENSLLRMFRLTGVPSGVLIRRDGKTVRIGTRITMDRLMTYL
jgi:thiol-disulfide isomerase/thioredoxin